MTRANASARPLVPDDARSPLSLTALELAAGDTAALGEADADTFLFVTAGAGTLRLDGGEHPLGRHVAALVLRGEEAEVEAGAEGLGTLVARAGAATAQHAPMGERAATVAPDAVERGAATGSRSFRILYGPHNGSLLATLFLGAIPPGAAKRHYHLYDEIVWVVDGPARLHRDDGTTELPGGAAFRLAPQERHIVENLRADGLTVLGLFTPAGSPSAAYLDP